MRVAYTGGFDSSKEPGATGGGGSGYCHFEPAQLVNAGGSVGNLYFVNPWITNAVHGSAFPGSGNPTTTVYIYANFTNTRTSAVKISTGSLLIQVSQSGANQKVFFIGGLLLAINYQGQPYQAGTEVPPSGIAPGTSALLIFQINGWNSPTGGASVAGQTFVGLASITNGETGSGYYAASIFLDGLYIKPSC